MAMLVITRWYLFMMVIGMPSLVAQARTKIWLMTSRQCRFGGKITFQVLWQSFTLVILNLEVAKH